MDDQAFVRYGRYAQVDPMPRAFAALAAGTVTTSNRIVPESKHRSIFVNEYLLPLGAAGPWMSSAFEQRPVRGA
jgi:hypothetical protein